MSKFFEAVNKLEPQLADPSLTPPAEPRRAGAPPQAASPARKPQPAVLPPPVAALDGIPAVNVRLPADSPLLPFDGSHEAAAERYRIIRTKLLHHPQSPRILCISSSGVADGKSVNAVNLAGVLALKQDSRVLLVDSDLRRSTLASMLGAAQSPGLAEVLGGTVPWRKALCRVAEAPNLYFMPSGQPAASPAELLDSTRWKETCDVFREHFHFVVIDSPPIGAVTDYDLIQSACDGVIIIARQDHTSRKLLLASIDSVPKERLIGVILNCATPWILKKTPDEYGASYRYYKASEEARAAAGPQPPRGGTAG